MRGAANVRDQLDASAPQDCVAAANPATWVDN